MFKLLFVLLAGCALSCLLADAFQIKHFVHSLVSNYLKPKHPFSGLDSYLTGHTGTKKLADNLEQLEILIDHDKVEASKIENPSMKLSEIRDSLLLLSEGATCSLSNLKKLFEFSEAVWRQDEEELDERDGSKRLGNMLLTQMSDTMDECWPKFVSEWNDGKIGDKLSQLEDKLKALDKFNASHIKIKHDSGLSECKASWKCFCGSVRVETTTDTDLETGRKVAEMLANIHAARLSKAEETVVEPGHKKDEKIKASEERINSYLLQPCKSLTTQAEVQSILKRMDALGKIFITRNPSEEPKGAPGLLQWTARYMTCNWLLGWDVREMAKLVSKSGVKMEVRDGEKKVDREGAVEAAKSAS